MNRHGLKHSYSVNAGFSSVDLLEPVKETKKLTAEEKEQLNAVLLELEESFSQVHNVNIDLTSMTGPNIWHENGLMNIHQEGFAGGQMAVTRQSFACPLKIKLCAKIDKSFLNLSFAPYCISFKWCGYKLNIYSDKYNENIVFRKSGDFPANTFVDIEWLIGKKGMAIKVNGKLHYCGINHGYVEDFQNIPGFNMSGAVCIGTADGSTVTIKTLQIEKQER